MVFVLIIILSISSLKVSNEKIPANTNYNAKYVEPDVAVNLDDPPFYQAPMPETILPIEEILDKGVEIPILYVYNDLTWIRQAYKYYWHSSYQRWSYVPNRIHYAMHRLFATYVTASVYYDFTHNLGIADEATGFKQYSSASPYDHIELAIMQSEVKSIYTYGNQIVVVASPQRTGLQVIPIPLEYIKPLNDDKNLLIQLVTSCGEEIDYFLIGLVKKD